MNDPINGQANDYKHRSRILNISRYNITINPQLILNIYQHINKYSSNILQLKIYYTFNNMINVSYKFINIFSKNKIQLDLFQKTKFS